MNGHCNTENAALQIMLPLVGAMTAFAAVAMMGAGALLGFAPHLM
jgi:hypothetical protein